VANAVTYVWTLPAGATIASGEWTNAITVDFAPDASSGPITVYGNNLCGNGAASPAFNVTVTPLPSPAGTITGNGSVCPGMTGVAYSVPAISNATGYVWTLPAGATIASGTNTNSITVDFDATASTGVMNVKGTNSCGVGVQSPSFTVVVNPIPPTPVITQNGDVLSSSAPAGNQWYLEGVLIPGATGQTFTPDHTGNYTCIVTLEGCSSAVSNTIYVIMTGMQDKGQAISAALFPNPCDGRFTLRIHAPLATRVDLSVINNLGLEIYTSQGIEVQREREEVVNLNNVPAGVYWVRISCEQGQITRKVIIR
jgi:hypothetical protein